MSEQQEGFIPLITAAEARSFLRHAHVGAKHDPNGEGVTYSLIQPYDLERFALTVLSLLPKKGSGPRYVHASVSASPEP